MEVSKTHAVEHCGKVDLIGVVNSKRRSCRVSRKSKICNEQTAIHKADCKPKGQTEKLATTLLASWYGRSATVQEHLITSTDVTCYDEPSELYAFDELEEKCLWIAEEYHSRSYTCKVAKRSAYRERQQRVRICDLVDNNGKQMMFSCSTELMRELQKSSSGSTRHGRRPIRKKECSHLFYLHVQLVNQGANTESKLKQRGQNRQNGQSKQTMPMVPSAVKDAFVLRNSAPSHSTFGKTIGDFLVNLQYREITPEDYDMLLQLEETTRPRSLSMQRIRTLESFVVSSLQHSTDVCCICLEPFKLAQRLKVLPVCRHEFHEGCISSWLSVQSTRCPLDGIQV